MMSGEEPVEPQADETIDLRGKICPMTFVYTKLALEKMQPGQVLKVTLDYPPAYKNVPQSVTTQGLGTVITKRKEENAKSLWIKKACS
jgi:tRNA 2-thiouridine synthesizing protein A